MEASRKQYVGYRSKTEGCSVSVRIGKPEDRVHPLEDRDPGTGFEWGYGGTGPFNLAKSMLWDFLGEEPVRPCAMNFKAQVIAKLPRDGGFELDADTIETWLEQNWQRPATKSVVELEEAPFVAFGNEELAGKPAIAKGDWIDCPTCKGRHVVEAAKDLRTGKDSCLLTYKCGESSYLAGLGGKNVMQ